MNIVTLAEAKRHLHIFPTDTDHDIDVLLKIQDASDIIMDYLGYDTVPTSWVVEDTSPIVHLAPFRVRAATLLVLGELFQNRESGTANVLSDHVKNLLRRTRPPTIA